MEVIRRFIWNFFRVENDHMTNVSRLHASHGISLPFSAPPPSKLSGGESAQPAGPKGTRIAKDMGRIERGMVQLASILNIMHTEDFGRKSGYEWKMAKDEFPDDVSTMEETGPTDDRRAKQPSEGIEEKC